MTNLQREDRIAAARPVDAKPAREPRPDRRAMVPAAQDAATPARPRPDKPRVARLPQRDKPPSRPRSKPARPARGPLPPTRPPEHLEVSMRRAVGAERVARALRRLGEAADACEAERYDDARRLLAPLTRDAPDVPEVRELQGVICYRLGKWNDAINELEAFRELSGSAEQHPPLMDAYRALRRWADVDELYEELCAVSPSAPVMTEGRIVAAGARADQGDLTGALRLLEQGWRPPRQPSEHHLRRAYALADLYERTGQQVRARELFRWVARADREFADVRQRLHQLR